MGQEEYWHWILNIQKVEKRKIYYALRKGVSPKTLYEGTEKELAAFKFTKEEWRALRDENQAAALRKRYEALQEKGIRLVGWDCEEYPYKLRHCCRPPFALYVKGALPKKEETTIAIVGARECSSYGRELAFYFAKVLADQGIGIVSGLARGVDTAAHMGALKGKGKTYAVLGNGVDICYPAENRKLYEGINAAKGGLLSEYPPGVLPSSYHFPMRNRIISGLSDGILLVEARRRSGALITVEHGLDNGRDIFVIPGKITDDLSAGCNQLIKAGAIPVTGPGDLLDYYGILSKAQPGEGVKKNNVLDLNEKMVYSRLCLEPKHIDEIAAECGFALPETMKILFSLEAKLLIKQSVKNYYIRCLTS